MSKATCTFNPFRAACLINCKSPYLWCKIKSVKIPVWLWENLLLANTNTKGTDQPANPCNLISTLDIGRLGNLISLASIFVIFKLAYICGCGELFETYLVHNLNYQFPSNQAINFKFWWPKMSWKTLTERDHHEWNLNQVDTCDKDVWRSCVRSAKHAASQLPGWEPTDVDNAPAHAR